ncbi:MAG: alpha/beta fold hydrolase [Opitutaceae bacterium]|nr:alpha/beta fold hydrolase [Opitutaceae bacterium]
MTASLPDWLRALYPFKPQSFTTAAGARMSYVDEGEGDEAVLMLHGNPTWSFYYRELITAVAPQLRCVVPDHVGMGLSDKPQDHPYTLESRIADIEALVASLGLKKVHLVVHDWGGAIGFGFAGRHPDLIGRIVVLNTAAFRSPHLPARIALCKAAGVGPLIVRGANGFAGPAVRMAMARRRLTPDERRGFLWPYDSWANRVAVSAFVRDIPMAASHPTWTTLSQVEAGLERFKSNPALIVWGGRDFCFNDHFYAEWRQRLPQAETLYLADAGHYVLADANTEVVPRISRFLTGEAYSSSS